MSRTSMSEVASRRTGAERVRRWRRRQAAFRRAHDELERELGREPNEAEMMERLEQELARTGQEPAASGDEPRAAEQTFATASGAFELRIAAERTRIFDLVMAAAEAGDISATLWLASRIAPAARSRSYLQLPGLKQCDLATASGVERAVELVIQATAAGRLALEDSEPLLRALG